MKQLNSHNFEEMYKKLGVDIDGLGCIMLNVDGSKIKPTPELEDESNLYSTTDEKKYWIKGFVAGKTPHVTLLFGLMESGKKWVDEVGTVLKGLPLTSVKIKEIGFFDSPYKEEPYYCIVAHLDITPELLEGHQRLQLLPHIDTFVGPYKAHITIAYIKRDEKLRDAVIEKYNQDLQGVELDVTGLNLGGKKE